MHYQLDNSKDTSCWVTPANKYVKRYDTFEDYWVVEKSKKDYGDENLIGYIFKTEWAASEFTRFCNAIEPSAIKTALLNPRVSLVDYSKSSELSTFNYTIKSGNKDIVIYSNNKIVYINIPAIIMIWLGRSRLVQLCKRFWYGETYTVCI